MNDFQDLEKRLGVDIDAETLLIALTHRSYAYEHPGQVHNERLEFLGDSVLGLAVTDEIYRRYPARSEGELAKIRASVVSTRTLAQLARGLDLGPFIRLGKGEVRTDGQDKNSILADTMESIIGAVYLTHGIERARSFVLGMIVPLLEDDFVIHEGRDWKTEIQELAAMRHLGAVSYAVVGAGPDHNRSFVATCVIGDDDAGAGEGTSKKEAERRAAAAAYLNLTGTTLTDGHGRPVQAPGSQTVPASPVSEQSVAEKKSRRARRGPGGAASDFPRD
ncbi:ribonuclease III [Kocuria sp.]|uniref:ribonuclease III n=1 Tax=Kocuria sp. TaxID=1871328 RepID=UPI0026DF2722|nr:ribonuclease III [Kocuria sp.]MDO5618315.1 ribonuclease III [Kocuria sp.]